MDTKYGKGYAGVVQYPFGYGLSYTRFERTVTQIRVPEGGVLDSASVIEVTLSVKNTGTYSGKDVVQLYHTPQYYRGGIEKAHVNLTAFAETDLLAPGQVQHDIKLSVKAYDMASYDAYDKNVNGH